MKDTNKLPKKLRRQKHTTLVENKVKKEFVFSDWSNITNPIDRLHKRMLIDYFERRKQNYNFRKKKNFSIFRRYDRLNYSYYHRRFVQKQIGGILTYGWFKSFGNSGEGMLMANSRGAFQRKMPRKAAKMRRNFPTKLIKFKKPPRKFFFNEFLKDGFIPKENLLTNQNWFRNFCIILYKREVKPFKPLVYYNFWFMMEYTG